MFSRRVPRLATNRLADALASARQAGRPLIDLSETNPTRASITYPASLLAPLGDPRGLVYEPAARGLTVAREAVALDLLRRGVRANPDRIVLTASTSEAYAFLFKLLCDPGDEVLVPVPSYPLFEHLCSLDGVRSVPYRLESHGRWSIDMASVEAAWTDRTRAVVVVSPNNPTGSLATPAELDRLAALCGDRGAALVDDEVFGDYMLASAGADVPPSFASVASLDAGCLTFALGGLSKSVGLPQLKLAWMTIGGPPALVEAALLRLDLIGDTYLSVSTPVQLAAPALFEHGKIVHERILERVRANLQALRRTLLQHPSCSLVEPEGGWSACIRVPAVESEEALVVDLLVRGDVLVLPGYFYDFPAEAYLIVSLLVAPESFAAGISRVMARLEAAARV
jgi:alanine-synthesizing transaminase